MRVSDEDTEYDDDLRVCYEGEPFTGEVVTEDEDGRILEVASYLGGISSGPQEAWHPDGSRKHQGTTVMGVIVGDWYEWHANGQLARHLEHNEKGHEVRRRKWAKDGTLLQDYDNSGTQSG